MRSSGLSRRDIIQVGTCPTLCAILLASALTTWRHDRTKGQPAPPNGPQLAEPRSGIAETRRTYLESSIPRPTRGAAPGLTNVNVPSFLKPPNFHVPSGNLIKQAGQAASRRDIGKHYVFSHRSSKEVSSECASACCLGFPFGERRDDSQASVIERPPLRGRQLRRPDRASYCFHNWLCAT
jgi:hypothetical protein